MLKTISQTLTALFLLAVSTSCIQADAGTDQAESTVAPAAVADEALTELAVKYLEANVIRDSKYVFENSIDLPKGSYTGIGSGTGTDWKLKYAAGHLDGLKKVGWEGLDPKGYVVGDVAWFTDLAHGVLPDGKKIDIRISLVMRKVGDEWKTVHHHVSEGVDRSGIKKEE